MNGRRNKGGSYIKCSVELNWNFWYLFQKDENIYLAISKKVTTKDEATCLGIWLGIGHGDIEYYFHNYDVRDAAYCLLCRAEDKCGPVEKWQRIIEALRELNMNTIIIELGLENKLEAAKRKVNVIGEGNNGNCFK